MSDVKVAAKVSEYNSIALSYLKNPPKPKLSLMAIAWYKKSLALKPDCVETHLALAKAYSYTGQSEKALDICDKALKIVPDSLQVLYFRCMLQIPILYRDTKEIKSSRRKYYKELKHISNRIKDAPMKAITQMAEAIGAIAPFYLIYQGYNDTQMQEIYGKLITEIMARRYPQWSQIPEAITENPDKRISVGIVFGHFHLQSVWKVIVKGWISQLNKDKFRLTGYSLGKRKDQETDIARDYLDKFVDGPHSLEEWCKIIRLDSPQILIYPEVHMKKLAIKLSALRLAPIQCNTWGNYVTSGLPTMDYVLSGTLIEPDDAEQQYTEKLIKLPDLSIYYTPPRIEPTTLTRQDLGLRPLATIYLCVQSLFKYLPDYDSIFPRIAQVAGDCQFVFLKHKTSELLTKIFEKRLKRAFSEADLNMEDHVVMLPCLTNAAYCSLHDLADVFLDSIGTGGATTTLEAIPHDLPVVTLPGKFLRGRFSYGILKQMGVTETVADSVDHYVEIAGLLGKDLTMRQRVKERMAQHKEKVFKNTSCIRYLENFLSSVVRNQVA